MRNVVISQEELELNYIVTQKLLERVHKLEKAVEILQLKEAKK